MTTRLTFVCLCSVLWFAACSSTTPKPKTGAAPADAAKRVAAVKAALAAYSSGDLDKALTVVADDVTWEHLGAGPKGKLAGKAALAARLKMERKAFPDAAMTPVRIFVIGDRVIVQGVWTGTQKGAMGPIPATGKRAGVPAAHVFTFKNGKVVKMLAAFDPASMMRQLGAMPSPMKPVNPPMARPTGEPEVIVAKPNAANEALYRKMQNAKPAELAPVLASNIVAHAQDGSRIEGVAKITAMVKQMHTTFPDAKATFAWTLSAGDWVIGRMTMSGTHKGPMGPIKPTGKTMRHQMIDITLVRGGKFVESHTYRNVMEVGRQLGLLKPPAKKPAPAAK